jgi:hypothetical protein
MLQHQMLTSQMFTFMSGCLCQLFQQSGLQLPQPLPLPSYRLTRQRLFLQQVGS